MTTDQRAYQPSLFEAKTESADIEKTILYGLGEFQSRGFQLVDRCLPLDRLRGAFKRAAENFGLAEFTDEQIAGVLQELGANVEKVPIYVAKHPFRVTVNTNLAVRAAARFKSLTGAENE